MESENKRFKVYFLDNMIEVINIREEDRDDDFVGRFNDICSRESLLRIASEGYGISEEEIEFVN